MQGSIDSVHNYPRSKEVIFTAIDDRGDEVSFTLLVNKPEGPDINEDLNRRIALGISKMTNGAVPAPKSFEQLNAPLTQLEQILG